MPEWFHTKSTITTGISQGRRTISKKSSLTMATIETVGMNMVSTIVID